MKNLIKQYDELQSSKKEKGHKEKLKKGEEIKELFGGNIKFDVVIGYPQCDFRAVAEELADKLNIPVDYISGTEENLSKLPEKYNEMKFPIDFYINLKSNIFC